MSKKTPSEHINPPGGNTAILRRLGRVVILILQIFKRYPAHVLCGMLTCIIISGILAFTVMRSGSTRTLPIYPKLPLVGSMDGISEAIGTYGTLQNVLSIQDTIAAIINKDSLDKTDSLRLVEALKRFEQLQRSIYKPGNKK
ncbi:hypothetical protein [Sphingobacterium sp. HMA12]|uniref:hypothetical protein n=1 Tax=Sphingobacterium sp. HMA12 TaxID=2050894 RepID=UPI000CEA2046|nr:hypothetical protein [Sphingobacterium sp. HMA12]